MTATGTSSSTGCSREPAPGAAAPERCCVELFVQLRAACPPGLLVMVAPMDVQTGPGQLAAAGRPGRPATRDFGPKNLPVAPLLAVEVLSPQHAPHTTSISRRRTYERIGVPSYWIVDPTGPGALTVFEMDDEGRYRQVANVEGDEEFVATRPFPVTVVPARLLDGLHPR